MSTPVGQTATHWLQSMQSPASSPWLARGDRLLGRHARLAAVEAVADVEGVLVGQRRLDARPRAHVDAHLLAHVAGERIGGEGEDADPDIGDERRLAGRQLIHRGRRIAEIEHPGAAGPPGGHQPQEVLERLARQELRRHPAGVGLHALAPVAFGPPLDSQEQVGPHRLRAEIAAPDAAGDRIHQEQSQRRQHQEAGDVVDLLRPDLDEEEVELAVGQVEQHRLAGGARSAVPADERREVVDAERDDQHQPLGRGGKCRAPSADRPCDAPRRTAGRRRDQPARPA